MYMPIWSIALLVIILILLAVSLYAGHLFFNIACAAQKPLAMEEHTDDGTSPWKDFEQQHKEDIDYVMSLPCEETDIQSNDGLRLHARFIPAEGKAERMILCAHGYKGTAEGDFGRAVHFFHKNCSMLLIDERCCGKSEGQYITFGAKEKEDVILWEEWLEKKNTEHLPVYLYGISLGCATVLMCSDYHFSKDVKGIVADCGYTSMKSILGSLAWRWYHIPGWYITPFVDIWCRIKGHFAMNDADAEKALRSSNLPVIFFHGTKDDFVIPENSKNNYAACTAKKELYMIEGAIHAVALNVDPDTYTVKTEAFFKENDRKGETE
jgi:alpha-beta hydrolase superfamily lysophospholipase